MLCWFSAGLFRVTAALKYSVVISLKSSAAFNLLFVVFLLVFRVLLLLNTLLFFFFLPSFSAWALLHLICSSLLGCWMNNVFVCFFVELKYCWDLSLRNVLVAWWLEGLVAWRLEGLKVWRLDGLKVWRLVFWGLDGLKDFLVMFWFFCFIYRGLFNLFVCLFFIKNFIMRN